MNTLEKFFSAIKSTPSPRLKDYTTGELIRQLPEFDDHVLFVLRNIYQMLSSENAATRACAARVLGALRLFEYRGVFALSVAATKHVYLQAKDIADDHASASRERQRSDLVKKLKLSHADTRFLDTLDLSHAGANTEFRTAEIVERPIENVHDFFEAINVLIFSPDWYKRHGALLAHCEIFSGIEKAMAGDVDENSTIQNRKDDPDTSAKPRDDRDANIETYDPATNKIIINLNPNLFSKVYEILKNDKFNDFVNDQTSAPVRETAAKLLFHLFPHINDDSVIRIFMAFLESADWQEQFSGLIALLQLKEHIAGGVRGLVSDLLDMLIPLVDSPDEDIKYLSAELIDYIAMRVPLEQDTVAGLLARCWHQIDDEIDIAHSKASIIILIRDLYGKYPQEEPASLRSLYPCFTSPVGLIRNSVIGLCDIFRNEEILYLLGECILLSVDSSENARAVEILRRNIDASHRDFGLHFLRLVSQDVYTPYKEDDFVCYNDTFFTRDGILSVGPDLSLANRVALFEVLSAVPGLECRETTMLSHTFNSLLGCKGGDATIGTTDEATDEATDKITDILLLRLAADFKKYHALARMPLKEFRNIILDHTYSSLFPFCNEYALEYVRMVVSENIHSTDISYYYMVETCEAFLRLITGYKIREGVSAAMLESLYKLLTAEAAGGDKAKGREDASCADDLANSDVPDNTSFRLRNCVVFFEMFGDRLFHSDIMGSIMESQDRLLFFTQTVRFYVPGEHKLGGDKAVLDQVFREALEHKNTAVLRHFMPNLGYNEAFVRHALVEFDPSLLSGLLEYSDPSFNVLFTKLILKNISVAPGLLGRVIPSLYFTPSPSISADLLSLIADEQAEVKMLVDSSSIPEYKTACAMSVALRPYQKEGIRWMAFLNKFNLNGILADDMGLGKTVQILTYMISEQTKTEDGSAALIVCPTSLTTHWKDEIHKYFQRESLVYNNKTRRTDSGIVIATYDNVRKDSGILTDRQWFMVVFDEGHLLKSRSTLLYTKATMLRSPRKFILTGTPIHNSIDDLFSLFNIILPGYLGAESDFVRRYAAKITEKNVDAMEKRLESLHTRILPFVMRRLKTEVLKDLPPKIIKDVIIDLSPEQMLLYRNLSDDKDVGSAADGEAAVNYSSLKNSPLILTRNLLKAASHPHHFTESVASSKTAALREILAMCGERKVLIFFQLKKTIDFVIRDLGITNAIRIDGTLPASQRGAAVSRFTTEPVQLLFLTTSVGGLGLNLAVADTVIFYEHDWNPFNDLQAMDRAHRLGQRNVVSVFRLIARNTIEERVMNYQNFKVFVASSVVTQQNTEIQRMDTKDLLERFQ